MFNLTDAHSDLLTSLPNSKQIKFIRNLPANVKVLNLAVFTTHKNLGINSLKRCKQKIENLQKLTRTHLLFSVEDIGTVSPYEIDELIKLKPFCVSLTWNNKNQYAGGALSTNCITKCGKQAIKKLEENNILIDTAHLNRKSFWQFSKLTTKPMLCTHANINASHKHPRNLTNQQIKKIVDSNGFIGLTIYQKFISNNKITAKDIAKQINCLIKNFGYKNFGFGTDFFGINKKDLPTNIKCYSDFSQIATELKNMGHSNKVIRHIFYQNFSNFLKQTNKI